MLAAAVGAAGVGVARAEPAMPGALCQADAVAPMVPLSHGLRLLAQDWGRDAMRRAGAADDGGPAVSLAMDLPWPEVLDEAGQGFPTGQQDLPWLITLAEAEMQSGNAAAALAFGTLAAHAPQLEAALNRQGQDRRAMLFNELKTALPGAAAGYDERTEILIEILGAGEDFVASSFNRALENYPADDGLWQQVKILALGSPELRHQLSARLARMTEIERLDWLVGRLEAGCGWSWQTDPETAAAMVSASAPAARDIVLLSQLHGVLQYGDVLDYIYNIQGNHAPLLLATLQAEGLTAEAEVLRQAMALLPSPWIRDDLERSGLLADDDALWSKIYALQMPGDSMPRIEAAMLELARKGGLLPKA